MGGWVGTWELGGGCVSHGRMGLLARDDVDVEMVWVVCLCSECSIGGSASVVVCAY